MSPPRRPFINSGTLGSAGSGVLSNVFGGQAGALVGSTDTSCRFVNPGWNAGYYLSTADVPNNSALNPNGPFTVELWAKPSSAASDLFAPVCSMDATANSGAARSGYLIYYDGANNRWSFRVGATSGYVGNIAGGTATPGAWQHVVGVYTGSGVVLYVDGTNAASGSLTGTFIPNTTQPFRIGATTIPNRGFDGWIDEVAFYGSALDANTIKAHYDIGTTNGAGYAAQILGASPAGYWRLNEAGAARSAANLGSGGSALDGVYLYWSSVVSDLKAPAYPGFGAANTVAEFPGTNGCVVFPPLNLNTNTVTIEAWVNLNGAQSPWSGFVYSRGNTANGLHVGGDGLELHYTWNANNADTYNFASGLSIPPSEWAYVAVAIDPNEARLFLGTSTGWTVATNAIPHLSEGFLVSGFIGEDPYGGRFVNGMIDEVAVYGQTLTEGQLHTHLLSAFGSNTPPVLVINPPVLTGSLYATTPFMLTADAYGAAPLSFQWRANGIPIPGATNLSYGKLSAALGDSGNYDVIVKNAYGAITSQVTAVTFVTPVAPTITQQPASRLIYPGGFLTLSVAADGTTPFSYQWQHAGTNLLGATAATLTVTNAGATNTGSYTVTVTNIAGSAPSTAAILTLDIPKANSYEATLISYGPFGYWRLNETTGDIAYDYMGGNDGLYTNVTLAATPGALLGENNMAPTFDGSSGYVVIPPQGTLEGGDLAAVTSATFLCWMNQTTPQASYVGVLAMRPLSTGLYLNSDDTLNYSWNDDGNTWGFNSALIPPDTAWALTAVVVEPNQTTFYLGTPSGVATAVSTYVHPAAANFTTGPFAIAKDINYAARFYSGSLQECAIFTNALTADQITKLWGLGFFGAQTPPSFVVQPASHAINAGASPLLAATAQGSIPISFQWQRAGTNIPGATTATLSLTNFSASTAGGYDLVVSNLAGMATSSTATLTVRTVTPNTYEATVASMGPLGYWRLNETSGTTAFDYAGGNDGLYENVTLGAPGPLAGDSTSKAGTFDGSTSFVRIPPANNLIASVLTNVPEATFVCWMDQAAAQGNYKGVLAMRPLSTGLYINGDDTLNYSWMDSSATWGYNSGLVPAITAWTFAAVVVQTNQATFYMGTSSGLASVVSFDTHPPANFTTGPFAIGQDINYGGTDDRYFNGELAEAAIFTKALTPDQIQTLFLSGTYGAGVAPSILHPPAPLTAVAGSPATLSVTALGSVPLGYQWRDNGTNLPGATADSLVISNASSADTGSYSVVVTNAAGSATSAVAQLTVLPAPTFANLTNGLVLHLKFDGDLKDSSGHGNDATASGSPTFVTGRIGSKAIHVNTDTNSGTFNYVSISPSPDLSFTETNSFSVSFWVNYTGLPNDLPMIGNSVNSTYQLGWVFTDDTGKIECSLVSTANAGTYVADPLVNSPVTDNSQWHLVTGIFDRTLAVATVYVDGALAGTWPIDGLGTLDQGYNITLGQDPSGTYMVDGTYSIDDVGIWQRALSPYEAAAIYAAGQRNLSFDVVGPPNVSVSRSGANIQVSWSSGTLLESTNVKGPYTPVPGATPPVYNTTALGSAMFFRVQQ